MKNKRYILVAAVAFLLFLNLVAGVLVKASPACYSNRILLAGLVVAVLGIYFLQTMTWLFLGKHYQLSFVYPFLGINYVLSLFVGMAVFHEPFIWRRLIGAVIILCGVSLFSFSKNRNEVCCVKASA